MVGQSNSVKCLFCKLGPDRLGPHRPGGAGSTGAASTNGAGSTGAASTWGRIGLGPLGFGAGSTYYLLGRVYFDTYKSDTVFRKKTERPPFFFIHLLCSLPDYIGVVKICDHRRSK